MSVEQDPSTRMNIVALDVAPAPPLHHRLVQELADRDRAARHDDNENFYSTHERCFFVMIMNVHEKLIVSSAADKVNRGAFSVPSSTAASFDCRCSLRSKKGWMVAGGIHNTQTPTAESLGWAFAAFYACGSNGVPNGPIIAPCSVRWYGGCVNPHHGRERGLWFSPRSLVVRLFMHFKTIPDAGIQKFRTKQVQRRRGSGSDGTHALSDAPAWAIRLNTLDFRGLISRRGTYHIAFDHGGAAMMHGAIVMGRPCFVCRWRQPPPATMRHCEWRRVWLVRGRCHECWPFTQISIGGGDVATDRLFCFTRRPMECNNNNTTDGQTMGVRTPWTPDVANTEDVTIQSDVGRWRRRERERARRVFLCRTLFLVQGLLIRYLFVRSWHLPATAMMMMI
jgi:hypothetical protein